MIEWINERIMALARRLEHNHFITHGMRVRLESELSKLLKMREKYHEQQEKEKKEKRDLLRPEWRED